MRKQKLYYEELQNQKSSPNTAMVMNQRKQDRHVKCKKEGSMYTAFLLEGLNNKARH
jgi:hypothetical protein